MRTEGWVIVTVTSNIKEVGGVAMQGSVPVEEKGSTGEREPLLYTTDFQYWICSLHHHICISHMTQSVWIFHVYSNIFRLDLFYLIYK